MDTCIMCVVFLVAWAIIGLIIGLIFGPILEDMSKHYPNPGGVL